MNEIVKTEETTDPIVALIERIALDPSVDPLKMQQILDVQERIMNKRAEQELNVAMAAVSANIPVVPKNGNISLGKDKDDKPKGNLQFIKYEDMIKALKPIMTENGLSLSFDTQPRQGDGGGLVVTATLSHIGGASKKASFALPLDSGPGRNNIQAMGSSLSYGQRYCVKMLFNIVHEGEDDDGVKGGAKFIDENQMAEISALIKKSGADAPKFFDWLGCSGVEDVKTTDYQRAIQALNAKIVKGA